MLSPYSAFGVGAEQPYLNVRNMAMGGITIGLSGHRNVTPFNPASYKMGVDTMSVMFDIGFNIGVNQLKQKDANKKTLYNQSTTGGLSNLEFYFPIFKWWKMGIYLLPVTDMDYLSSNYREGVSQIGKEQLVHKGNGGLSKVGWGNSFGWGPIAFGINLNYQFGRIEELVLLNFKKDSLAANAGISNYLKETALNGLVIDVGVLYSQPVKNDRAHFSLGASYTIESNMVGRRSALGTAVYSSNVIDTAFYVPRYKGDVKMPATLRTGISYEEYGQFLIGFDFTYSWWKNYSDFGKQFDFYRNTYSCALGAELKSNPQALSLARRIAYRIGGRYQTYYTAYDGSSLTGFAISVGVGIPVRRSRSQINIGLEYGHTGSLRKKQIQEDYVRIGVSFSSVETWFVKRKYD